MMQAMYLNKIPNEVPCTTKDELYNTFFLNIKKKLVWLQNKSIRTYKIKKFRQTKKKNKFVY